MHNKHIKSNHRKIPPILLGISGVLLFSYLTFTPTPAHAAYDWEKRKLSDITTMQEMNAKICENTTEIETQYTLRDTRDDKIYYVAKLKDGNCWMTQNLAYSGGGIKQCELQGSTTCSGWLDNVDGKARYAIGTHTNSSHDSQGNFYSWEATVNSNTNSTQPKQGICPDNWQLPTSDGIATKSFDALLAAYGISGSTNANKMISSPLYFVRSGNLASGQLLAAGGYGYYWSSIPNGNDKAYLLRTYNSSADPSYSDYRSRGFSVRCVNTDVYPEEPEQPEPPLLDDNQANVSITVSPVISIDVTQHVDTDVDFTHVAKSNIIARVGSNQPYQVLFSTEQSNLEQSPILTNQNIPMITSDQTITAGTSNWGIKKLSSPTDTTTTPDTIYSPIGIGDNKALFYTSNTAASEDLTFPVAIAVSPQLPSGKYSTQVTLTAVAM